MNLSKNKPHSKTSRRLAGGLLAAGTATALYMALGWSYDLSIKHYELYSKKLSHKIRLLHISDLHSCRYGHQQSELCKWIGRCDPDVLLYTGDIFDEEINHDGANALFERLAGRYPAFYVTGNHEYKAGNVPQIKETIRSRGVTVLENEWKTLTLREQTLNICGAEDPLADKVYESRLDQTFAGLDTKNYTIFLAHRPEWIPAYAKYPLDLQLSGHAHGGQWRIPGTLNGLFAPNQGFFPKYAGGRYTLASKEFIVSRGLARESTRIPRLFNTPELVMIDLLPQHLMR